MTGLALVFGRGLLEAPGDAFIVAGLVYAAVPGIPALLAINRLRRTSLAGRWSDLASYAFLSATAAVLWFLPFAGLFVPADDTSPLTAAGGMALYHAASGAVGGLAFWLLTRRGNLPLSHRQEQLEGS
jgi:hypothetical protein